MTRIFFLLLFATSFVSSSAQKKVQELQVSVTFTNYANDQPIILGDGVYTNAFGEKYSVTKLKYYISNIHFVTAQDMPLQKSVYLIEQGKDNQIKLTAPGQFSGIAFTLGVDSILNCSGAQSGALDPLNDMFWTWNSGYVMFKMEGKSDSSKADEHRIEQHIGGYKGDMKAMREIMVPINEKGKCNGIKIINIAMDLDKYWSSKNDIKIVQSPVVTTLGPLAVRSADNFPFMFFYKGTSCHPL